MSEEQPKSLPSKVIFPGEAERETAAFAADPVAGIQHFLSCFDRNGKQSFQVPQHVLEALALCFVRFWSSEAEDLDDAFGGRTVQRRNSLKNREYDLEIVWDYIHEHERLKAHRDELAGTPSEVAYENTAKKYDLSPDAVRKIFKKLGVP